MNDPNPTPDVSPALIDATCSICGGTVRGELVPWEPLTRPKVDEEVQRRLIKATIEKVGGHVCASCGAVFCLKTHRKEVANSSRLRGYRESPCPQCGEPFIRGFTVVAPTKEALEAAAALTPAVPPAEPGGTEDPSPSEPDIGRMQWDTARIEEENIHLTCSRCGHEHDLSATHFRPHSAEEVEGLGGTRMVVRQAGLAGLLALGGAVAVFVMVYRAMYGPELTVGVHVVAPAFAAVFAHAILRPLFLSVPFLTGKKLPIYTLTCPDCATKMPFGTDGTLLATPRNGKGGGS